MLPPTLILRCERNDLLTLRDKPQQIIPREVLRDSIARIEAGPRVGLIEILRIGAAHREIDVLNVPVIRIVESEDHMITDLAPLLWRLLFRPKPPLSGLMENLLTTAR